MGCCLQSPKSLEDDSPSTSFKSKKSIGVWLTAPNPEGSSNQSSSSPAPHLTNLDNIKQNDMHEVEDVGKVNSACLASFIKSKDRLDMTNLLFAASNCTGFSSGVSREMEDQVVEMTYTQHQRLNENQHPSMILPTIYLGSKEDAAKATRLKEIGITHILCVTSGKENRLDGVKLLTVVMADNGNSTLEDIMNRSFRFIEESQQEGNKLLIHCERGQNRSATLLIAWLMSKKRWSLYRSYMFVKEARQMIKPHKLYLDQLRELDKRLFGIYSTPEDYLAMSFSCGRLFFGQDSISSTEKSAYASSQISSMTALEFATYSKLKISS